jgi:hypothetical protein
MKIIVDGARELRLQTLLTVVGVQVGAGREDEVLVAVRIVGVEGECLVEAVVLVEVLGAHTPDQGLDRSIVLFFVFRRISKKGFTIVDLPFYFYLP